MMKNNISISGLILTTIMFLSLIGVIDLQTFLSGTKGIFGFPMQLTMLVFGISLTMVGFLYPRAKK